MIRLVRYSQDSSVPPSHGGDHPHSRGVRAAAHSVAVAFFALCLLLGVTSQVHAWPLTDPVWDAVPYQDAAGEDTPADTDVVGDATYPAMYHAYDGANLCFRMRVNDRPGPVGSFLEFNEYNWAALINTIVQAPPDDDIPEYGLMVRSSGTDAVELWSGRSNSGGATDWSGNVRFDASLATIATLPDGTYARWSLAGDGSNFDGNPDYFVDVAIPYTTLLTVTSLPSGALLQVGFATSVNSNAGNFNKDRPDPGTIWLPSPPQSLLPELSTSPTSLDFGYVLVGTSSIETLSVGNTGSATLEEVAVGGVTPSPPFTGPVSSVPFIRPGDSTDVDYTYAPTQRGSDAGSVTITSRNDFSGSSFPVALSGIGVAPVSEVIDPPGTVYGRLGTPVTDTVTINNIGDGNLSGIAGSGVPGVPGGGSNLNGDVDTSGTYFALFGTPTFSLPDGGTLTFQYTYVPTARTTTTDTLFAHFANGGGNTNVAHDVPFTLSVTGVGPVYDSDLPPGSTYDYGKVFWYGEPEDMLLQVFNTTTDPDGGDPTVTALSVLSYEVIGTPPGMFQLLDFQPTAIDPGEILDIVIRLTPGIIIGKYVGELRIVTDEGAPYGVPGNVYTYNLEVLVRTPEPTSLALLGLGALALARRRRKR